MTEAELSKLPEGWYWTKLETIANFKNGINFTKSQRGDIGILTLDVFNMYSKNIFPKLEDLYRVNITPKEEYILKNGDILFVRSSVKREGVGWTTVFKEIGEQVTFCGFIIRGRLVTSDVFPKYLAYHLRAASARKNIIDSSSQVTITNINQNSLGAIPVPLPPLPEQCAIVSKIEQLFSELDNGISNLKLAQEQLKVYRQAVLKKAFEGELTKKWREQQTSLQDAKDLLEQIRKEREEVAKKSGKKMNKTDPFTEVELVKFPRLPEGWEWERLEGIGYWTGGGTPSKQKQSYWTNGDVLWVSPKDMKTTLIVDTEDKITRDSIENSSAKWIAKDSILFVVRSGIIRRILPIAIAGKSLTTNQDLQSLTLFWGDKDYVFWYCQAKEQIIRDKCAKDGTTVDNIEVPRLKSYPIAICSLPEQQAIVQEIETRLSVCDKIEQDIETNLEKAEALRQSILKKAFEGKLLNERELAEVRGAEDWEPAEVLLERIKKDRAKNEKK